MLPGLKLWPERQPRDYRTGSSIVAVGDMANTGEGTDVSSVHSSWYLLSQPTPLSRTLASSITSLLTNLKCSQVHGCHNLLQRQPAVHSSQGPTLEESFRPSSLPISGHDLGLCSLLTHSCFLPDHISPLCQILPQVSSS